MKKLFIFITLAVFAFSPVFAQLTHTAEGAVDEAAKALLKKAAAKMSGTVSFTVTVVSRDANKKEVSRQKAEVLYNSPRYRVKSNDLEVYSDGKAVWQYNKTAKEVMISPMTTAQDDLTNPAVLLANYNKAFRAKYIRDEEDGTAIIDLQPKKSRPYHKVRVFINSKTGLLKKMEQHNYDSSRDEFIISNFKNTKAADADFTFDTQSHPNVEVVDMR